MRDFFIIFKKEILVLLRNTGLVLFLIYAFTMEVYTAGKGIEVQPRNVPIGYVINDSSNVLAYKILSKFHSPEFQTPRFFFSEDELKRAIFDKKVMVGIIFPQNFSKDFYSKGTLKVDVLLDATAASQSQVTLIYINNILSSLSNKEELVNLKIHKLFNQNSHSTWFMSITQLISITTMLTLILVSIVFVKEKEKGTWDIMLLMPVSGSIIILAKVISQVFVVLIGIFISLGLIVFGVFDTPINGNLFLFFLISFLFTFSLGGISLVIAAYSKSVMQVSQMSLLVMMPLIFLSGAWTPISSMSPFLQKLTLISPVRYYIQATESIFFRGAGFYELIPYFIALIIIGIILFTIGFRKIGKLF